MAKKRKEAAAAENKNTQVEDPLGGLEPVEVVIDNAEEDMPQQQEDNSDEHSSTASNAKPMVEITNGHHNNEGPPKQPAFNFWDDVPAEEYAAHQPKAVVVEPVDRTPIEFPF